MPKPSSPDRNDPNNNETSTANRSVFQSDVEGTQTPPTDYLDALDNSVLASLNSSQKLALQTLIDQTIQKHKNQDLSEAKTNQNLRINTQDPLTQEKRSKLIDIRFVIDLIFSRFYVVLLVGKDVRKDQRSYPVTGITKIGNIIAATFLIIAINLLISAFLLLGLYLLKSALSIDLLPGHFSDQVEDLD
ncbi:MAG: hypothetical protein HC851_11490 [Acaryochloris sp. RU_4_1]|nr:hypothetical protein [Acaryochloris sp. SU_5_25]NJM66225.1 hypothetical protein [Acaryochloris sp. RU_4_1]NJR55313.1 hypothetical protein [Acaryochloris sp. CRU_2_0]